MRFRAARGWAAHRLSRGGGAALTLTLTLTLALILTLTKVSTWAGGAVDDADHMSATQLAAQFEAPRPPQKKALVIGISYGEGGAFPEPYVEPPEVEASLTLTLTLTLPLTLT